MPTDWAVVAATFTGPIIAVGITLWYTNRQDRRREERTDAKTKADELYARRLSLFRTLMATRRVGISPEHVNALNLIEVDFYECGKVEAAWKDYKQHLFIRADQTLEWLEEKEKRLSKLLFEIAAVLNFNIPAIDIFKGGYAPEGWSYRDALQSDVLEFFRAMSRAEAVMPVWVPGISNVAGAAPAPVLHPQEGIPALSFPSEADENGGRI